MLQSQQRAGNRESYRPQGLRQPPAGHGEGKNYAAAFRHKAANGRAGLLTELRRRSGRALRST